MDIQRYLQRIGLSSIQKPSLAYLQQLQLRHLLSIPFENLDIPAKHEIFLDPHRLYKKIVEKGRGGFCYELNGLFCILLRNLGFSVSMLSARVFDSSKNQFGPDFDHMTLLVHMEKHYLVDVGFGDSFRTPTPIDNGQSKDISGEYRIVPLSENTTDLELQRKDNDVWVPEYRFDTKPREFSEYKPMCHYHQSSPDSSFTQRMVCTIATETGRITLTGNSLTLTESGCKKKLVIGSREEFDALLRRYFYIVLE